MSSTHKSRQYLKARGPPVFFVGSNPSWEIPVFRILRPFVPLAGTGWHPYTSRALIRGVDRLVARCRRMWKRPKDWARAETRNHPQSTRHFFARFFGHRRRSIFVQDKGRGSSAPPARSRRPANAGRFKGFRVFQPPPSRGSHWAPWAHPGGQVVGKAPSQARLRGDHGGDVTSKTAKLPVFTALQGGNYTQRNSKICHANQAGNPGAGPPVV